MRRYLPRETSSHGWLVLQVMDMFVEQTHNIDTQMRDGEKPMRFTDTRLDEQERGVSLKMVPMSLVMEGTSGKSYLMNLIDTPGALPGALVISAGASLAEVSNACSVERTHSAPLECMSGDGQGTRWKRAVFGWLLTLGNSAAREGVHVAMRAAAGVLQVVEACCMARRNGPGPVFDNATLARRAHQLQ